MTKVGRNDQCPCGSGRKAKKCHPETVGQTPEAYLWYADMLSFIEGCDGYQPPMSEEDRLRWKMSGCPFGYCPHETDGISCAAGCGV